MKYKENESLSEFILEFDRVVRELKSSDAKPSDSEIICYLLLAMPDSYDNVVTAIETLSSSQLTLEFVKRRLLEQEIKKINREKS